MAEFENVQLDISVDNKDWQKALPSYQNLIEECFNGIMLKVSEGRALSKFSHIEVSVVLCDDKLVHQLNQDYREQDKATNVLSFCGLSDDDIEIYLRGKDLPEKRPYSLGEIYIAYETMYMEAKAASISFEDHFQHLVIHGLLHLLGYDHIVDGEAEIMEALETSLLNELGIDDPYAA